MTTEIQNLIAELDLKLTELDLIVLEESVKSDGLSSNLETIRQYQFNERVTTVTLSFLWEDLCLDGQ